MVRPKRASAGGLVYHVLNRANARQRIFRDDGDYAAFERVLCQAIERIGTRLLGYCIMPNHWHLMLWPREDGELSAFGRWVGVTHTQRWHANRHSVGSGHLYQGRFKSFVVQDDSHYLTALRYVERNAVRARLAERAEAWRWGSLWTREHPAAAAKEKPRLSDGPVPLPRGWRATVNEPLGDAEAAAMRASIVRGRSFGDAEWAMRTARQLGLETTFRPRGRPKKASDAERVREQTRQSVIS